MIFNGFFHLDRLKVIVSIVVFIFLVLFTLFWGWNRQVQVTKGTFGKADLGIGDFSFIQTKEGRVQWEIKAEKAEVFGKEETLLMKEIKAKFLTPEGSSIQLTGDRGKMNTKTHDFLLEQTEDPLKISMDNGLMILTKSLDWSNQKNEFKTVDPVQILGEGIQIQGKGLIANIHSQEIRILNEVRVIIKAENPKEN